MAIKELISNAFDAEATLVTINTKSGAGSIVIHDNGVGMDYTDFDQNFTYISKSKKTGRNETTPSGRPIIGRLGIGFIAVLETLLTLWLLVQQKKAPIQNS